jgi:PAS domain S-box-containing protein
MFEWVRRKVMAKTDGGAGPAGRVPARVDDVPGGIIKRAHSDERRASRGRRRSDSVGRGIDVPRVLIIEPDEDTRLLYAMLFEECGYTVYTATDEPSGLAIALHCLPDVVVTAIALPTISGFDILGHLHDDADAANIPVVVVTSYLHFNTPARGRAPGAILVLEKPSDPETLIGSVRELALVTPPERSLKRQLTRTLLALHKFGTQFKPDADAQQRVRALIDRLQVAVLALDEQGRYVAASPGASSLTGYSQRELLTMSIFDSLLEVDFSVHKRWQECLAVEQGNGTAMVRSGSGRNTKVQTAFLTICPGLHAAAIAPAPDAR